MDCAITNTVPIIFENRSFCFTGRAKMKRADIAAIVTSLGGMVHSRVTRDTDYLVVGDKGSKGWAYSSFGNKTLRARYIQFTGGKIEIIAEKRFWEGRRKGGEKGI